MLHYYKIITLRHLILKTFQAFILTFVEFLQVFSHITFNRLVVQPNVAQATQDFTVKCKESLGFKVLDLTFPFQPLVEMTALAEHTFFSGTASYRGVLQTSIP